MAGRQLARAVMLNDDIFMDDHAAAALDKAQNAAIEAQEAQQRQQMAQPMLGAGGAGGGGEAEAQQPQPQEAQVA